MKSVFILSSVLFLITISCSSHQQKSKSNSESESKFNCDKELLSKIIDKKPKLLDNGSKLYWNYSCDSSWLTFENKYHQTRIIYSLPKEVIELTHRIGYFEFKEYATTFLYENRVISGCCVPGDYYLHDKQTGKLLAYLGRAIFVSDKKELPFVLSISNSGNDTTSKIDYNTLKLVNLETQKDFSIELPTGAIEKGIKNNDTMFPEDLFSYELKNSILMVNYYTDKYIQGKSLKEKTIEIDLSKYFDR